MNEIKYDLRECPYCGHDANICIRMSDESRAELVVSAECDNCFAKIGGFTADISDEEESMGNLREAIESAVEGWNARVTDGE